MERRVWKRMMCCLIDPGSLARALSIQKQTLQKQFKTTPKMLKFTMSPDSYYKISLDLNRLCMIKSKSAMFNQSKCNHRTHINVEFYVVVYTSCLCTLIKLSCAHNRWRQKMLTKFSNNILKLFKIMTRQYIPSLRTSIYRISLK